MDDEVSVAFLGMAALWSALGGEKRGLEYCSSRGVRAGLGLDDRQLLLSRDYVELFTDRTPAAVTTAPRFYFADPAFEAKVREALSSLGRQLPNADWLTSGGAG